MYSEIKEFCHGRNQAVSTMLSESARHYMAHQSLISQITDAVYATALKRRLRKAVACND